MTLDDFIESLAQKIRDDTDWDQIEIVDMILPLKEISGERMNALQKDWI